MASVRDAVILAGGRGTRMLPASLYMPKETMPLVDTPVINHLIWESAKAGVTRIHLVLSERKKDILGEFLKSEIIHEGKVRVDLPRDSLKLGVDGVRIIPHIQPSPGGVADAITAAIGQIDGPFLVLLGDMVILDKHMSPEYSGPENASNASMELVAMFEENNTPCVGVYPVESEEISNYGVVQLAEGRVIDLVEKPSVNESPGNYVLCGRYLLPENTSEILQKYPVSEFGEMQSIRLLKYLMENGGLNAVKLDHMKMYDSGDPFAWLKSQVDHALRRDDIGVQFYEWIKKRILE